jgi:phage terminase large subunit GpA-like protein
MLSPSCQKQTSSGLQEPIPPEAWQMYRSWFQALKPQPRLTVSQWADKERHLSREASAEPGRWDTTRAEYQRGIMDAVSDPTVHTVVVMSSAQVGKTEVLLNAIGFYVDQDPSPILMVQPTLEMAEAFSKDRLAPMLRDSPALQNKVKDPRARDSGNTLRHKVFDGGHITLSGANSPASLASRPIRIVLCDEVDRFDDSAGTEGDPVSLAAKRSINYWNRKLILTSTPTRKGLSRIEKAFSQSDQRRCFVPCPYCATPQVLKWENVRWDKDKNDKGETIKHHPHTAHVVCLECGSLWNDVARWGALRKAEWQASAPFLGVAGFHLSELYSPWRRLSEIVEDFLEKRHDPTRLQTFVNTSLGETWEEAGETVPSGALIGRVEAYDDKSLPGDVSVLTAGIDTQDDRLEVQVIGWGAHEESWVAWYEVIPGDPAQAQVWKELDALLLSSFHTAEGRTLKIGAACIDTGGHHAAQALSFCRARRLRRVFATKGIAGARPIWPMRASRANTGDHVYLVGVDTAKDAIYGRLKIGRPGPGFIHFPHLDGIDAAYFEQLTAERVVTRYREGRPYRVWVKDPGKRNEVLDTFVLALAARHCLPRRIERGLEYATGAGAPAAAVASPEPDELVVAGPPPSQAKPRRPFRFGPSLGQYSDPYL